MPAGNIRGTAEPPAVSYVVRSGWASLLAPSQALSPHPASTDTGRFRGQGRFVMRSPFKALPTSLSYGAGPCASPRARAPVSRSSWKENLVNRFHGARLVPLAVLAAAAAVPATTVVAAPAAAATTYTVTDLGSLGFGGTVGSGINATGQVTGYSYLSTLVPTPECPPVYGNTKKTCVEHPWHAFLYSKGTMTDLGTVGGGDFSGGSAINLSGQVAGWSATKNQGSDAFFWNGQKMTDLGNQAPLNGSSSGANGINDSGQVVGQYGTASTTHAFLYSN